MNQLKEPEDLQGLFDYADHALIVEDLMAVTGLPREKVLEKLVAESFLMGSNVVEDAKKMNIDVHVFNEKMDRFYRETNAFVFELINVHQTYFCKVIDLNVMEIVARLAGVDRSSKSVLMLGDGIGSDSLRLTKMGFKVTYFEFAGYSSALAKRRFERLGVSKSITQIHELDRIPRGEFDFVICREVLEHVEDPPGVVSNMNQYLVDGGYALITESFSRVEPMFPTHLRSNLKYAGKTVDLFIDAGFRYEGKIDEERPFVFQKTSQPYQSRKSSIPRKGFMYLALRKVAFKLLDLSSK